MKINFIFIITLFNCQSLFSQRILIVDIGRQNRTEVGTALSNILNCHPRIVGIDALYVSDSLQLDTIMTRSIKMGNVVMAAQLHYLDAPFPFWDSLELPNDKFRAKRIGFSNIYTEDGRAVPEIPIYESYKAKLLPSFSYEVARGSKPGLELDSRSIMIHESDISKDFPMLSLTDILAGRFKKDEIENSIILFGFAGQQFKINKRSKKSVSGVQLHACFVDYLLKNYSN